MFYTFFMAKVKTKWVCQECGYETAGYLGKCPECGSWGSFVEEVASSVENVIETIEDIESSTVISEENGVTTINIVAKKDKDIRELLAEKLLAANITVLEQSVARVTLEDVYLQLTSEEYYRDHLIEEGLITRNTESEASTVDVVDYENMEGK